MLSADQREEFKQIGSDAAWDFWRVRRGNSGPDTLRFWGKVFGPTSTCQCYPAWVHTLEFGDDPIVRHISVQASLPDILHVPPSLVIVFLEKRIVPAIELQWVHTETPTYKVGWLSRNETLEAPL